VIAITMPAKTNTTITIWVQNQWRGITSTLARPAGSNSGREGQREANRHASREDEDRVDGVLDRVLSRGT
jgi:hypothetical protein